MGGKKWYDYMWILSAAYLILGFFNIALAWLGLICFFLPLAIAAVKGNKAYCNKYCGRGQLFDMLGKKLKLSRNKSVPKFLKSRYFRYGFLVFFMAMFANMLFNTYLVFSGASGLREYVKILWTFNVPWSFAGNAGLPPWAAQFAFGFYGVMATSTIIGMATMALFKPRSWCVYCPMGTMTQAVCRVRNKK